MSCRTRFERLKKQLKPIISRFYLISIIILLSGPLIAIFMIQEAPSEEIFIIPTDVSSRGGPHIFFERISVREQIIYLRIEFPTSPWLNEQQVYRFRPDSFYLYSYYRESNYGQYIREPLDIIEILIPVSFEIRSPYILKDIPLRYYILHDSKWYPFDQYGLDCTYTASQEFDRETGEQMFELIHCFVHIKNLDPAFIIEESEGPPRERTSIDGFGILIKRPLYLKAEFIMLFSLIFAAIYFANKFLKSKEYLSFTFGQYFHNTYLHLCMEVRPWTELKSKLQKTSSNRSSSRGMGTHHG